MLAALPDLRETLFAARMLREHIRSAPIRPDAAGRLRRSVVRANTAAPSSSALVNTALAAAADPAFGVIRPDFLRSLAAAAGGPGDRTGPGVPFQGRAAPPAPKVPELLSELCDTLNAPIAVETWPPIARAFCAHFLIRLVQPFDAPAHAVGFAAEAAILAADGFPADRFLLPEPDVGADASAARPDPDAFVRARLHRLVERLADLSDRIRTESARAVVLSWCDERESDLTTRQRQLLRWLAETPGRAMEFRAWVKLHSGRGGPSLRSLQRDWKGLRESGLVAERGGRLVIDADAVAWDTVRTAAGPERPGSAGFRAPTGGEPGDEEPRDGVPDDDGAD